MNATKTDFFNALKGAVMFSPANEMKCRQLQTFRVLEQGGGAQLAASNFGATICDKSKPYFWSRAWHNAKYSPTISFEFPVLAIIEKTYTVDKPISRFNSRCYEFNISVLDKYTADCEKMKCSGCNGRTINEIYEDTETLLFSALGYLRDVVEATLSPGDEQGYYHTGMLAQMVTDGTINEYAAGKGFGNQLENNLKNAQAYKTAIGVEALYGNAITVQICFQNCETTEYNFESLPDFGVLAQEAGCQTCG
jgi:hypothetical protein